MKGDDSMNYEEFAGLQNKVSELNGNFRFKIMQKVFEDSGINFTKRMMFYYIEDNLIPPIHKLNKNQAYYTKEHIYRYYLISLLKECLSYEEIKIFFVQNKEDIDKMDSEKLIELNFKILPKIHTELYNRILLSEEREQCDFKNLYDKFVNLSILYNSKKMLINRDE